MSHRCDLTDTMCLHCRSHCPAVPRFTKPIAVCRHSLSGGLIALTAFMLSLYSLSDRPQCQQMNKSVACFRPSQSSDILALTAFTSHCIHSRQLVFSLPTLIKSFVCFRSSMIDEIAVLISSTFTLSPLSQCPQ